MKKWLFGAALLLALVCVICATTLPTRVEAATYGVLTYRISNGEVTITDCKTSATGELVIPDTIEGYPVTSIEYYAFYNCDSLTGITIPDGVATIGYDAFSGCSSLTSITLPDSITAVGSYAFTDCSSLENVYITDLAAWCQIEFGSASSNPMYYAENLYLNGSLVSGGLVLPGGITKISYYAFYNCDMLTGIIIPNNVTSICTGAFGDCSNLASIVIPNSVTTVGNYAFQNCSSLTSVVISDSVTSISGYAFNDCSSLNHVLYTGTEAQWNAVSIGSGNNSLKNATRHYNCTGNEIVDGICVICGLGDADGDQVITANDAYVLKQYRAGLVELDEKILALCDVSGDGKVDAYDAYLIQLRVADMIDKFPCEN